MRTAQLHRLILALRLLARSLALAARMAWLVPFSFARRSSRAPAGEPPLFCFSQVVWDEVWQRPQEFALRAARRRPIIFFCPVQIHRLYDTLKNRWRRVRRIDDDGARLIVVTPLIFPGEYKSRLIRRINACLVRAEMRALVGDGHGATLLANTPFAETIRSAFRWRAVCYDIIDDYAAFDWAPPEAMEYHDRLLEAADGVSAGTWSLAEQAAATRPDAVFVPLGVRFERFHRQPRDAGEAPPDLRDLPKPVIGYVGSLSDRLDADLIRAAAARYPDVSFVMIGPVHGSFGEPPRAPNLHYLGLKPHEALPDYMNRFDLALLPFRQTRAARATNPVKTLEYLAAGCVVLSTSIPDVERFYGDVAIVARSADEFIEQIGVLLKSDNRARRARGIETARAASWDAMTEQLEAMISAAEEKSAARNKSKAAPPE